mmetsp:Transcript_29133/g.72634  ORF Transcript_29133/g.72634 Transcript_29133/m.72634 type:complete len:127 (-) Transcript_29133:432-812(-)
MTGAKRKDLKTLNCFTFGAMFLSYVPAGYRFYEHLQGKSVSGQEKGLPLALGTLANFLAFAGGHVVRTCYSGTDEAQMLEAATEFHVDGRTKEAKQCRYIGLGVFGTSILISLVATYLAIHQGSSA